MSCTETTTARVVCSAIDFCAQHWLVVEIDSRVDHLAWLCVPATARAIEAVAAGRAAADDDVAHHSVTGWVQITTDHGRAMPDRCILCSQLTFPNSREADPVSSLSMRYTEKVSPERPVEARNAHRWYSSTRDLARIRVSRPCADRAQPWPPAGFADSDPIVAIERRNGSTGPDAVVLSPGGLLRVSNPICFPAGKALLRRREPSGRDRPSAARPDGDPGSE